MTAQEEHDLDRSPLDTRGRQRYYDLREKGQGHTTALWAALNDFRDREKGLSWDAYKSFEAKR